MKTSCGKFLNLARYFPYDVKLRLVARSRSFLANQKARNAIVGAENLLISNIPPTSRGGCLASKSLYILGCSIGLFSAISLNDRFCESVKPWSQDWQIAAGAYPGFCSMKRLEVFLLPLDGMLVYRAQVTSPQFVRFPQQFAGIHL